MFYGKFIGIGVIGSLFSNHIEQKLRPLVNGCVISDRLISRPVTDTKLKHILSNLLIIIGLIFYLIVHLQITKTQDGKLQ